MEEVISCRLDKREVAFLAEYSKTRNETRASVLRELVEAGRKMEALTLYKEGKASLGKASKIAGLSISEMIDLLADFGVGLNTTLDDFRESMLHAKKLSAIR